MNCVYCAYTLWEHATAWPPVPEDMTQWPASHCGKGADDLGKKERSQRGDLWARIVADIVTRVLYFAVTAIFLFAGFFRYGHYAAYRVSPVPIVAILALSVLAAALGPWLYREARDRGRGSLKDVRSRSRRDR